MSGNITAFFETNFLKARYILENTPLDAHITDNFVSLPDVSFERITLENLQALDLIYQYEYNKNYLTRVQKRVDEPTRWLGYIARYKEKPTGCFWMLVPDIREVLYDSFRVTTQMVLFCGAYVTPPYRGKRIYNAMQYYSLNRLKDEFSDRKLVIIVERNNYSSLKSLLRSSNLTWNGKNYLFKLMGRNILSVYIPKSGDPKIWLVV